MFPERPLREPGVGQPSGPGD